VISRLPRRQRQRAADCGPRRSPLAARQAAGEGPLLAGGQRLPPGGAHPRPRRLAAGPDRPRQKKSGLPFFKEDRQLLRAIGSSAAWVLELEQNRSTGSSHRSWQDPVDRETALPFPEPASAAAELAKECP